MSRDAEVGARDQMSVGRVGVREGGEGRPPRGASVAARERLPVGRGDVRRSRRGRTPAGVTLGSRERGSHVGRARHARDLRESRDERAPRGSEVGQTTGARVLRVRVRPCRRERRLRDARCGCARARGGSRAYARRPRRTATSRRWCGCSSAARRTRATSSTRRCGGRGAGGPPRDGEVTGDEGATAPSGTSGRARRRRARETSSFFGRAAVGGLPVGRAHVRTRRAGGSPRAPAVGDPERVRLVQLHLRSRGGGWAARHDAVAARERRGVGRRTRAPRRPREATSGCSSGCARRAAPGTEQTATNAALEGHLHVLNWALMNGAPSDAKAVTGAFADGAR